MLFCVILLSLYAATEYSQDFVCGYGLAGGEVTGTSGHTVDFYRGVATPKKSVHVLPLLGKLQGARLLYDIEHNTLKDRQGLNTAGHAKSRKDLFDPAREGSLPHFFNTMSNGMLSFSVPNHDTVAGKVFESSMTKTTLAHYGLNTEADCASPPLNPPNNLSGWHAAVRAFVTDVIEAADADPDINFGDYDGDGDGNVDLVAVLTPYNFGDLCGAHGTVFYNYTTTSGKTVEAIITGDHSQSFPSLVGILAHEYGHVMDLPELFDRTAHSSSTGYADHSAGIGEYGVMAKGTEGYVKQTGIPDGPSPMSVWSRMRVGWIAPTEVRTDQTAEIHDIESDDGNVIQIPVPWSPPPPASPTEYFLLSNRQRGNYYNDHLPQSGLLIWHIDDRVGGSGLDVNINEKHKRVDVECADGLREDDNPTTTTPTTFTDNSVSGGDDLDYWTGETTTDGREYLNTRGGNLGDADDMWTPSKEFTPDSNPTTDGYDGRFSNLQSTFTGIAIRDITQNTTDGSVSVNIRFIPNAPTGLSANTTATENQVELSWTTPDVNEGAISGYQYSYTTDEGESRTWTKWTGIPSSTAATTTATIDDLDDADKATYTFKVRAVTANNEEGLESNEASVVFDRPGAVTCESGGGQRVDGDARRPERRPRGLGFLAVATHGRRRGRWLAGHWDGHE